MVCRKTSFHPLLWTSSGLKGTWKLSAYISLVSLRCAKTVIAHLPPGEGSNSPPGAVQLHSEANSSPPHPPQPRSSTAREENNSSQASYNPHRASQAGHNSNPLRANRQGTRLPPRLQTTQPSPEACATSREGPPPSHPPTGPAKVLPMKNLTLSGSLTFPTNL